MALPIASIPVLTGEVGRKFEAEAQRNYERYLNRTDYEKKAEEKFLENEFAKLHRMLAKAQLGSK